MSHFFAHLARMKLIYRWPLMRNVTRENIAEHSLQVAMVAHSLALIGNTFFAKNYNPDSAATLALFHDSTEVLTGDLPTPVKYYNKAIIREYNKIELAAEETLLSMLPARNSAGSMLSKVSSAASSILLYSRIMALL